MTLWRCPWHAVRLFGSLRTSGGGVGRCCYPPWQRRPGRLLTPTRHCARLAPAAGAFLGPVALGRAMGLHNARSRRPLAAKRAGVPSSPPTRNPIVPSTHQLPSSSLPREREPLLGAGIGPAGLASSRTGPFRRAVRSYPPGRGRFDHRLPIAHAKRRQVRLQLPSTFLMSLPIPRADTT
jgi:hypothetical protein